MKPVIYQLVVRYFGNTNVTNQINGTIGTNGCGKFNDINVAAINGLKDLGVTHIWLTGVLRQATLTSYAGIGMEADDADIVKGLAGSFYAVRDYFDVCPDYGSTADNRMEEFESLIGRIHAAGMAVLIDFVPNHVSRGYNSIASPAGNLGRADNATKFFSSQNNFFYLVDPPDQSLQLSRPSAWNPAGVNFDGRFAPEDGGTGRPAKATGNNITSPRPSVNDWYETIKLNYGFNFVTRETSYSPQPRTWGDSDGILAFWQAKGVDGFRCDFAHYVPKEAWTFLIGQARARRSAFFLAEAYPFAGSADPIQSQQDLIDAGFDAIYHYQSYNALKGIYTNGQISAFDQELVSENAVLRRHFVSYIENHDERRVASPIVQNQGPGASGFGSAEAAYQIAPLQFLYGSGPALLFNGQEVGEPAAGVEGFGGDDGKTTIYDYWAMPEFAKWVNRLQYDGGGLSASQIALRKFYSDLNHLCQNPAISGDGFWGLLYFNNPARFHDCPEGLYSYARFQSGSGAALLVAANFQPGGGLSGVLRVPAELSVAANFPHTVKITMILNRGGAANNPVGTFSTDSLASTGFPIGIENQAAQVYSITAS